MFQNKIFTKPPSTQNFIKLQQQKKLGDKDQAIQRQQKQQQQGFQQQQFGIYDVKDGIIDEYQNNVQQQIVFATGDQDYLTFPKTIRFDQHSLSGGNVNGILSVEEGFVWVKVLNATVNFKCVPFYLFLTVEGTKQQKINDGAQNQNIVAVLNSIGTAQKLTVGGDNIAVNDYQCYEIGKAYLNKPILLSNKNQIKFDIQYWGEVQQKYVSVSDVSLPLAGDLISDPVYFNFKFNLQ